MPYSALEDKKNQLIRKSLTGSMLLAPFSASLPTALTTTGADLATLPTGYADAGWLSSDGVSYARAVTASETTSFGSVEPTRTDITKDVVTCQFTCQQTSLLTLGLYIGVSTSGLTADHTTGELQIEKPERPAVLHYRALGIFVDQTDDGEIYIGRLMPKARVTDFAEQKYTDGDQVIEYQVTLTGFNDASAGYSHKFFFAGPGWLALLADAGVTQA